MRMREKEYRNINIKQNKNHSFGHVHCSVHVHVHVQTALIQFIKTPPNNIHLTTQSLETWKETFLLHIKTTSTYLVCGKVRNLLAEEKATFLYWIKLGYKATYDVSTIFSSFIIGGQYRQFFGSTQRYSIIVCSRAILLEKAVWYNFCNFYHFMNHAVRTSLYPDPPLQLSWARRRPVAFSLRGRHCWPLSPPLT